MALTRDEKLNAIDRKSAPGRAAAVTSDPVLVISCAHVPFPMMLELSGVKRHNAELVDVTQDPVYTEISPWADMEGMKASLLLLKNGRFGDITSRTRLEGEMVDDMLSDTNSWALVSAGRKAYARFLFFEVIGERSIVVGL